MPAGSVEGLAVAVAEEPGLRRAAFLHAEGLIGEHPDVHRDALRGLDVDVEAQAVGEQRVVLDRARAFGVPVEVGVGRGMRAQHVVAHAEVAPEGDPVRLARLVGSLRLRLGHLAPQLLDLLGELVHLFGQVCVLGRRERRGQDQAESAHPARDNAQASAESDHRTPIKRLARDLG